MTLFHTTTTLHQQVILIGSDLEGKYETLAGHTSVYTFNSFDILSKYYL